MFNTANSSKYYSKHRGNFYPAIGNPEILSLHYELILCWLSLLALFISNLEIRMARMKFLIFKGTSGWRISYDEIRES
jgi:hypothetical protein